VKAAVFLLLTSKNIDESTGTNMVIFVHTIVSGHWQL
jgi:hypothetical protein